MVRRTDGRADTTVITTILLRARRNRSQNVMSFYDPQPPVIFKAHDRLARGDTDLSFLLLGLARLVLLLHVLDESEGRVQVGGGSADLSRLLRVRAAVGSAT